MQRANTQAFCPAFSIAVPHLPFVPGAFPFLDQLPKTGALF
jgi:hypothetical protein